MIPDYIRVLSVIIRRVVWRILKDIALKVRHIFVTMSKPVEKKNTNIVCIRTYLG